MKSSVAITVPEGEDPFGTFTTRKQREKVNRFTEWLRAITGTGILNRASSRPTIVVGTAHAFGTVTLATVSAADTVTLNGVAFTAVAGAAAANQFSIDGTDIVDATALVTSINASVTALVSGYLKASNKSATATLASVAVGDTITVDGVTFRAVAAATPLSLTEFSQSGDDTADAAALAAKINAHPYLREQVMASSAAAVVTIRQLPWVSRTIALAETGTTITLSAASLAATAIVGIFYVEKGQAGNMVTLASSNGSRLAVSGARLTGGSSTTLTF